MANFYFTVVYLVSIFLSLCATAADVSSETTKPNIVFVFVDDWGYSDVGFRNPAVKTPNFDMLASTGLILDRHYVFKLCSPSRASLLTGRWPHHVHQFNMRPHTPLGTNSNMTMLPAKLKLAGYDTHIVGKWHQGFVEKKFLPVNRGFDTSFGILNGVGDHMNQFRRCATDMWMNHAPNGRNGTYSSYLYRDELSRIFADRQSNDTPMFLYFAPQNVHSPFQVPEEWLNIYPKNSTCDFRRTYQAMVSVVDNVTGYIVELLKRYDMWDNTIMIISSDNGAAPCKGSNYPLKGAKATFFEGGVRALAFANGGLLPDEIRGKKTEGFIHIADWYTTFCNLAGVEPSDSGPGKFPVDGVDVWPILTGENTTSPHKEIILGYNYNDKGAIIVGDYKLIVGIQGTYCNRAMHSPLNYPCEAVANDIDCSPYCLYNIVDDPEEHNELSEVEPQKLQELLLHYNEYSKEPRHMQDLGFHSEQELPKFVDVCKYMNDHGGYWQPWEG